MKGKQWAGGAGGASRSLHVNRDCPKRSSARLREESRVCSGQVARVERGGKRAVTATRAATRFSFWATQQKGQTFSLDMHLDGVSGIRISALETCPRCSQGSQKLESDNVLTRCTQSEWQNHKEKESAREREREIWVAPNELWQLFSIVLSIITAIKF